MSLFPGKEAQGMAEQGKTAGAENLFAGGGEMGALMRSRDWSLTSLGPPEQWPQSLKTAVRIMLTSRQAMFVWWGEELINLYNDAYKSILGGKHPTALGQPASIVWRELWDQIRPRAESAMFKNEGTYDEALQLIMERNGYPEETYYTFSYSPVPNDQEGTGGIICANTDETQRMISERQLALFRELAARTADARTFDEACKLTVSCLETNPYDLPFAMIYLVDSDQQQVTLAGTSGIDQDHVAVPKTVAFDSDSVWHLGEVAKTHKARLISNLGVSFDNLPSGAWQQSGTKPFRGVPHQAIAVPITPSGQTGKAAILVAGLNPFRLFDDNYERFIDLVASQISVSIANAQAYEEERKRAEALAELDRAKTTFFSNVSHEFRTPLTLILNPLEDLLSNLGDRLQPAEREQLQTVQRNSLRLLKLVNTLLDFSRIEAGRIQAVYEPTDLSNFTAELASVFRSTIEKAGMRLIVNCPPLPEPIYVDQEMWEKIVLNLLSNAFKFTFKGEITVSLRWASDHVELAVQDTGIGIRAKEISHLFERFYRVPGAQGRTYEGSGIGLSLVQELVKLHGGTIQVSSVVDQGTCFTLSIPRGTAHLPSAQRSQAAQDAIGATRTLVSTATGASPYIEEALRWLPTQEPKDWDLGTREETISPSLPPLAPRSSAAHILLADDNADMRDYVKRLLSQQYEVEAVADGVAALAAVRQQKPDLVLTDVMMPKLDGFGLLKELRADPTTQEIPIILLSARAGEESRVEGLEAGADDYLIKPFSARELLARIEANLKMAQMRQAAAKRELELRLQAEAATAEAQMRAHEAEEAQSILHLLLKHVPESITITGGPPDFPIIANSRYAQEYLGKPGETLVGMFSGDHVHSYGLFLADRVSRPTREQMPLYRATHYGESISNEEWVIQCPDGTWITAIVQVEPIRDSQGQIIGAINCWRDITERKQMENALRQSEERFRQMAETIQDVFWIADLREPKILYVSPAYEEIWGRSRDSLYHNYASWFDPIHSEDRERVQATALTCLHEDVVENEYRIVRPDGSIRWIRDRGFALPNKMAQVHQVVGIAQDITDRKRAEAQIRQQADRLQRLAEAALTINATLCVDEIVRLITEQAREIIGAHQSVISITINQNWAQAIHRVSLSDKYAQWRDYGEKLDGSGIYSLVCQMQRSMRITQAELEAHPAWRGFGKEAGKHPPMRGWLAAPLTSRNNSNIGLLQLSDKYEGEFTEEDEAILVQLAQMASAAINKAHLYEESQRANRIKDEFLAVLSHELRSPLNPILGWSALLRQGKLDATKTAHALEIIERNAKLQTQLIEDLLDVSRILQGKLSLNMAPVNLALTIEAAMETVRLAAIAKSILIQTDLDLNVGQVLGDAARLQQVIWNLLSNAVKFTPEGGDVEIRLECIGSHAQIQVRDTGKGIPLEFLPHVFEYFRQADSTTTRKFGGLGLGLAIVRHLVELHGGTVGAESPGEEQGATFTVRFPLIPVRNQPKRGKAQEFISLTPPTLPLSGIRVLVVDDNMDANDLTVAVLEEAGASVISATSAIQAIQTLAPTKPDVLVSDIGMPDMDGYMLMQQVRAMPPEQGGQILAIALTAYAGEINQQQALVAGFQRHLSKPIEPAILIAVIIGLIERDQKR